MKDKSDIAAVGPISNVLLLFWPRNEPITFFIAIKVAFK